MTRVYFDGADAQRRAVFAVTFPIVLSVIVAVGLLAGAPMPAAAQPAAYVFVPRSSANQLTILDPTTNSSVADLAVGSGSIAVAASPDGRLVLVANLFSDTVSVIDVPTRSVVATIPVGDFPQGAAFAPDGHTAYVTNGNDHTISVLDMSTNTVVATIPVGLGPRDVAFTPDGSRALVANQSAGAMSLIDVATGSVIASIPTTGGTSKVVITPDGTKAYATQAILDRVAVIDLTTNMVALTIPTGMTPDGIAISRDGATVYVANGTANSVSVIDVATDTLLTTFPAGGQVRGIAVTPDGGTLFVSGYSSNNVLVINASTHALVTTIPVSGTPAFLAAGPDLIRGNCACAPTTIANDAGLTAQGFGDRFVDFLGGALTLTGNWTTTRAVSLLDDTVAPYAATIDTAGFDATITGPLINDGVLLKRGAGTLTLQGVDSRIRGTRVEQGTLAVVNTVHPGTVTVAGTGTVSGSGLINAIAATAGTVSPGAAGGSVTGILSAGAVTLAPGVTFVAQINGPVVDTGYDRLDVSGVAALNGATLVLQAGYVPAPGTSYTIVTHATGTFAGLPEGSVITVSGHTFRITYHGGVSGLDVVLTADSAPTLAPIADQTIGPNSVFVPVSFTIGDDLTPSDSLLVTVTSSNLALVHDNPQENTLSLNGTGVARTLSITPERTASGQATITLSVSDGYQTTQRSFLLTVTPMQTYYLAEGSTGGFFETEIAIANPTSTPALAEMTFYKDDGTIATQSLTLLPTSAISIPVSFVPGMEAAAFSTSIVSVLGTPLVVERTMWWNRIDRYGASTEKASEQTANQWYFAEGSQGFFHSYFLLLNPNATDTIAHVTYLMEDGPAVQRDYPVPARTRVTVDAGAVPELINRSFGAHVVFDQPGLAERAMYFGESPLFSGGAAATGVTALATDWFLAEGATGTFFDTFVLIANPNDAAATLTVTYLPASGIPVVKTHPLAGHQRLTINIATEDPTLASAAVSTRVQSDQPVVVERAQYWPHGGWYESHASAGETSAGLKWGLAEGRVGGFNDAQTYILIANPGTTAADITATFLRTDGTTLVKHFIVDPTSRFNISVINDGSGNVPELHDESFGTIIESTQPVIVEHSMYSNANGVIWAAGTNATATRLP